jgi:hypothetical protein
MRPVFLTTPTHLFEQPWLPCGHEPPLLSLQNAALMSVAIVSSRQSVAVVQSVCEPVPFSMGAMEMDVHAVCGGGGAGVGGHANVSPIPKAAAMKSQSIQRLRITRPLMAPSEAWA